jgi:hypothetical protein
MSIGLLCSGLWTLLFCRSKYVPSSPKSQGSGVVRLALVYLAPMPSAKSAKSRVPVFMYIPGFYLLSNHNPRPGFRTTASLNKDKDIDKDKALIKSSRGDASE